MYYFHFLLFLCLLCSFHAKLTFFAFFTLIRTLIATKSLYPTFSFIYLKLIIYSIKGAQIAGQTAKKMQSAEKIGVIIGLDPAAIGFDYFEIKERLSEEDADYVQVIHTDITKFGMAPPMGHGLLLSVILSISSK